jgi:hypothetical protein
MSLTAKFLSRDPHEIPFCGAASAHPPRFRYLDWFWQRLATPRILLDLSVHQENAKSGVP